MLSGVILGWRLFNPDCLVHIMSYLAHFAFASLFYSVLVPTKRCAAEPSMHNRAVVYLKEDGARLSEFALLASVVWVLHLLQVSGQSEG